MGWAGKANSYQFTGTVRNIKGAPVRFDIVIGSTPEDPAKDAGRTRQPRGQFRPQSGAE